MLIAFDGADWSENLRFYSDDEGNEIAASKAEAAMDAFQLKVLTQLRNGLKKIGLEELACYDKSPPGYALVAHLANPEHDLKKAARELTKLVWGLADR